MTAAAEEAIAEDHIINLAELTNYQSGTADCPAGITASYGKAIIQDDYTIVIYTLGYTRDEAFYLNGAEYDASDYAGEICA